MEYFDNLLEKATCIDNMEREVNHWEANFLESIIKRLNQKIRLTEKQEECLQRMYNKYLG